METNKNLGNGEVLEYDLKRFNFKKIFQDNIHEVKFEDFVHNTKKSDLLEYGYKVLRSPRFLKLYRSFVSEIASRFYEEFYYQAVPTFRIQKPHEKAVTFHIDEWSGHGKKIINYWVPLVDLNEYNSLWVIDPEQTQNLIDIFKSKQLSLDQFEPLCRSVSSPMILSEGNILCFSNKTLHGTVLNSSTSTRVSFDFRILPFGEDPGLKSLNTYYSYFGDGEQENEYQDAISIVYCVNSVSHLSHDSQRSIIDNYCSQNNLKVVLENNELLSMDHYPVLNQHIDQAKAPLVIFSIHCLPTSQDSLDFLLKRLRNYPHDVHFALEGKTLEQFSVSEIMNNLTKRGTK